MVFARAFESEIFKEGRTGVIDLDDDDENTVKHLMSFLINGVYNGGKARDKAVDRQLLHISVYAIADKYDIPHLRWLAQKEYTYCLKASSAFYDLPVLIEAVTSSTPPSDTGLRTPLINLCAENYDLFSRYEANIQAAETFENFHSSVLKRRIKRLQDQISSDRNDIRDLREANREASAQHETLARRLQGALQRNLRLEARITSRGRTLRLPQQPRERQTPGWNIGQHELPIFLSLCMILAGILVSWAR